MSLPGGGGGQTQTTTTEPWSGVRGYLRGMYGAAKQDVLNRPLEFFPGQTYVDYSPETEMALTGQYNRALAGSPLNPAAQNQVIGTLGGQYLGQNPYLDQLQQNVLGTVKPGVDTMFEMAGRGGSPLQAEALGRGVSQGMAPHLFGSYEAERQRMMDASRLAPQLAREDYFDIGQLGQVGAAREAMSQRELSDAMARHEFAQMEPYQRIQRYGGILGGTAPLIGGAGGMTTGTQQQINPLALGLGLYSTMQGGAMRMLPFMMGGF